MYPRTVFVIEWNWNSIPGYICREVRCGQPTASCSIYDAAKFRDEMDARAWFQELALDTTKWRIVEHALWLGIKCPLNP